MLHQSSVPDLWHDKVLMLIVTYFDLIIIKSATLNKLDIGSFVCIPSLIE